MLSLLGTGVRSLIAGLAAFVAVLATAALPSAAVAVTDVGASERIDAWLAANESFRARFTQTVFDEDGFQLNESRGTVAFRRPYRFRWDYEAPEPQNHRCGRREPLVVRHRSRAGDGAPGRDRSRGDSRGAARRAARPRRRALRVAALELARGVDWIELVPRGADAALRAIRVGLEGEELRAIEMEDGFGQTTRIEFFDVESDPPLADELFRFVPPPEADVVRGE